LDNLGLALRVFFHVLKEQGVSIEINTATRTGNGWLLSLSCFGHD
jgi:hypothetical protein